jgi:hypothetical protein
MIETNTRRSCPSGVFTITSYLYKRILNWLKCSAFGGALVSFLSRPIASGISIPNDECINPCSLVKYSIATGKMNFAPVNIILVRFLNPVANGQI